jgi:hypothetical protein
VLLAARAKPGGYTAIVGDGATSLVFGVAGAGRRLARKAFGMDYGLFVICKNICVVFSDSTYRVLNAQGPRALKKNQEKIFGVGWFFDLRKLKLHNQMYVGVGVRRGFFLECPLPLGLSSITYKPRPVVSF